MSQVLCMEPVPSFSRTGLPKGRYDAWGRAASDGFRNEIVQQIGKAYPQVDCHVRDLLRSSSAYDLLTRVQPVDWSNGRDTENVALTMIKALFQKDEDLISPIDRKGVAFRAFLESEVKCGQTNRRILQRDFGGDAPDVDAVFSIAQRKISLILGDAPTWSDLHPTFGPGAAVTCRRKTTARHKLSTPPSISNSARAVAVQLAQGMYSWANLHRKIEVVPGVLEFVPKNYATDRSIVIEPSLTGCYQRALGGRMKKLLSREGINLYDQSINRSRARLGSKDHDLCTIDLKAASDSIAYMLVAELLPSDWFDLLDSLRSDRVLAPDGKVYHLSKFSSMGNGYTFELESLLFYSLAFGLARHKDIPFDLTVYGDDLICNRQLAEAIVEWFPKFGFSVNQQKSFISGPFRESCGGDYLRGVDVRPFFIRDRMTYHQVCCFYNHLMRKSHLDPDGVIRRFLLSYVPDQYRLFGPDGYGDGHLVTERPLDEVLKPYGRQKGWEGYILETYAEVPVRDEAEVSGDVLLPAYQSYVRTRDRGYSSPTDRLVFDVHVPRGLRSTFLKSMLRELHSDMSEPSDHYVVRKPSNVRVKGRRVRVYVLGRPG